MSLLIELQFRFSSPKSGLRKMKFDSKIACLFEVARPWCEVVRMFACPPLSCPLHFANMSRISQLDVALFFASIGDSSSLLPRTTKPTQLCRWRRGSPSGSSDAAYLLLVSGFELRNRNCNKNVTSLWLAHPHQEHSSSHQLRRPLFQSEHNPMQSANKSFSS